MGPGPEFTFFFLTSFLGFSFFSSSFFLFLFFFFLVYFAQSCMPRHNDYEIVQGRERLFFTF